MRMVRFPALCNLTVRHQNTENFWLAEFPAPQNILVKNRARGGGKRPDWLTHLVEGIWICMRKTICLRFFFTFDLWPCQKHINTQTIFSHMTLLSVEGTYIFHCILLYIWHKKRMIFSSLFYLNCNKSRKDFHFLPVHTITYSTFP